MKATVGIDLAKNAFQVDRVSEFGKTVLKKQLKREQVPAKEDYTAAVAMGLGLLAAVLLR